MSDYYFNKASEHCLGLHKGMAGFHECARENNCMKPLDLKIRRAKKAIKPPKAKKPKKPKKKKGDSENELLKMLADVATQAQPISGQGRKVKGGCGSCKSSNWIQHVKAYQNKHGCSYKVALSEASKTYH